MPWDRQDHNNTNDEAAMALLWRDRSQASYRREYYKGARLIVDTREAHEWGHG